MQPIGPLMIEHRLIERMVHCLKDHAEDVRAGHHPEPELLRTAVDFFRVYADRTHHGKEEDILFEELQNKNLGNDHLRTMNELVEQHKTARSLVGELSSLGGQQFRNGTGSTGDLLDCLDRLVRLYEPHIELEDRHFFKPVMEYFSENEQQAMLERFREFDAGMIHETYRKAVERHERTD